MLVPRWNQGVWRLSALPAARDLYRDYGVRRKIHRCDWIRPKSCSSAKKSTKAPRPSPADGRGGLGTRLGFRCACSKLLSVFNSNKSAPYQVEESFSHRLFAATIIYWLHYRERHPVPPPWWEIRQDMGYWRHLNRLEVVFLCVRFPHWRLN